VSDDGVGFGSNLIGRSRLTGSDGGLVREGGVFGGKRGSDRRRGERWFFVDSELREFLTSEGLRGE
jgi:hypothetical protein